MPNFNKTTSLGINSAVSDWTVDSKVTEGNQGQDEYKWSNTNASAYYGIFYNVGEYKSAINSYATRVLGWGITINNARDKVLADHITGNGKETFRSILFNHLVVKKFNGDSYALIVTDDEDKTLQKGGTLVNLVPLDPFRMSHITNKKNRIIRYEYNQGDGKIKKYKPDQIFHSMNNRVLNEPHGTSETSAVAWVCEAIQEAWRDWRKINHRSSVRILYVDENDTTRQNQLKTQYADGIKNGDVLLLPCKPEEAKFEDLTLPAPQAWTLYIGSLEEKFYTQLGISKQSIGGTTENNTEASAKVNMVITEPVWIKEMLDLEDDVKNQLGLTIKINRQPSLMDNMKTDEAKNTGQTKLEYQGSQ